MSKAKKPKKSIYIRASKGKKDRYAILSKVSLNASSYGFATHLLENGIDLQDSQEALPPDYLEGTGGYLLLVRKYIIFWNGKFPGCGKGYRGKNKRDIDIHSGGHG